MCPAHAFASLAASQEMKCAALFSLLSAPLAASCGIKSPKHCCVPHASLARPSARRPNDAMRDSTLSVATPALRSACSQPGCCDRCGSVVGFSASSVAREQDIVAGRQSPAVLNTANVRGTVRGGNASSRMRRHRRNHSTHAMQPHRSRHRRSVRPRERAPRVGIWVWGWPLHCARTPQTLTTAVVGLDLVCPSMVQQCR